MLRMQKELLALLDEKGKEIERLKSQIADLRVIAGYKFNVNCDLTPCDKLECLACSYAHRFADGDGGWVRLCIKSAKCKDFAPKRDG